MARPILSLMPAAWAALLVMFAIIVLPGSPAYAADDCLVAPNSAPPQGSHWYYRLDRPTQRKCWYVGPEGREIHPAPAKMRPTAESLAPLATESAGERPMPPAQIEQPMTQSRPAMTVRA